MMKNKLGFKLLIVLLVLIITGLHNYSGPSNSTLHQFFKLLYFIPVIAASFKFGFRGGTITALLISIIYSPQKLLSFSFNGDAINELFDILLFFAIGIITGILVEKKNLAILTIDNQLKKYVILENYTNSIFESIRNGIVSVNKDFFITSMNSGAKKILGVTNDCIGANFLEIFPSGKDDIEKIISAVMATGEPRKNVEKNLSINGEEVTIEMGIYPLSLDNKNKGLVIIMEDITEMKKIKDQMQRNDKLAAVGELATGIAHEIRNPLAIIKMIEQTMQTELKENKDAMFELKIIDEEVERANKVIKSLMEFGKPSKNEKNSYCLNEIIEDVFIIVNNYTSKHHVNVCFEKGEIPYAEVDKEQLKQAFVNLIFNAVDAMPNGGDLVISTEYLPDKWIKVIFQDSGEGIAEEHIDKIYSPFFTTKDEGTGLGLSIVHRIIEDHGGIIKVTSKLGKGTRFELFFPAENSLITHRNLKQVY
jgi:two-component system, sporulation sensor kinase E